MPASAEMKDHVYKILELVGSSEKSIEDGSVRHYQVTLRVGFTLEG